MCSLAAHKVKPLTLAVRGSIITSGCYTCLVVNPSPRPETANSGLTTIYAGARHVDSSSSKILEMSMEFTMIGDESGSELPPLPALTACQSLLA
jgi:hypothetical protein